MLILLFSLYSKIWPVRKTSIAVLTSATVQCDATRGELLLCHAASLAHKTGPKDLQRGLLEYYKGQSRFLI